MRILLVSAEAVPFAKVGGLADVVGSLPAALRQSGLDARVIIPGYGFIEHLKYQISRLFSFDFGHKFGSTRVDVYTCVYDGVPFYFVQAWPYFGNERAVYLGWNEDVPRFIFFNQVVLAAAWQLRERLGWFPDVFHVHDWHTALLPFLLADSRWKQEWQHTASVLTIHNIAYQGNHVGGYLWQTGIPTRDHHLLRQFNLTDNMLGIATAYCDIVTTVSPRYATEIQYPYAGYELAGLIRARASDLRGILNGIDTTLWNPETDPYLISRYHAGSFEEQRIINKRHLQSYCRLPIRDDVPVIGVVSRLTRQKGLDLALPALHRLLAETDVQFVLLGTGDADLEYELGWLALRFPEKARVFLTFDGALSQHIYSGCDIFLMPSHFEPCGIGQMIAMRYGALPLVRETGGLADTVINYDNGDGDVGTGFVFQWEEPEAVLGTLRWALETYYNRPKAWRRMQRRAMQMDLSWSSSAGQYIEVYELATRRLKGEA
ncbi:MAG: glycogen synthase [Anaerolineae bacterium]|jgi:starch synthase|nr:glycogen synthase [Anaerolineae bacterium]